MSTLFNCVPVKINGRVIGPHSSGLVFLLHRAIINWAKIPVHCVKVCRPVSWLTAVFFPPTFEADILTSCIHILRRLFKVQINVIPHTFKPLLTWVLLPSHSRAHQSHSAVAVMELWCLGKMDEHFCRILLGSHEKTKNGWVASNVRRGKNKF